MSPIEEAILAYRQEHPDWTAAQIAAEVGCGATKVRTTLQAAGIQRDVGRAPGPGHNGERSDRAATARAEAIRLRSEGRSIDEIADKIGRSKRSVLLYLSDGRAKKTT